MIIAKGTEAHPLGALRRGGRHTLFAAETSPKAARKRWIMGSLSVAGALQLDAGAVRALLAGKSLLPIGVTKVTGEFSRGDAVSILDPDKVEIARGLVGLDSEEANLVKGKKSDRIVELLGVGNRAELVHRDNLVLLKSGETA
jgi:glutamate 5-kinase